MSAAAIVVPIVPAIRLKKILFATDFSEGSRAVLPVASAIARHYGSELLIAHVWAPEPQITPEDFSTVQSRQERAAAKKIAAFLKTPELAQLSPQAILRRGDPVEELKAVVSEQGIDLVVLNTHGRVGIKHLLMGSVAEALFRNLSCPVLTVGPHIAPRFPETAAIKNILFPTDLSEESRVVFPQLASLADEYGARITVLHVLPLETKNNPEATALAEPLRREMKRIFCPQISPRCDAEFVIDAGDVVERILAHAHAKNVELIGFGIRKAAAEITTHFHNTVTYGVVINAECPVLTCRFHSSWHYTL